MIDRARKENQDWDFGKLLPGIRAAAKKLTDAPKHETSTDFWGNINRHPIKPGQLVNRKTCAWYLDDLQAQCATYRGFVALASGQRKQAAKQFERIPHLQPQIAKAQRGHVPNNYSRLIAGVKNGYLIAEPRELKLYSDRQKQYILLGDFYYVTQHFRDSISIFQAFLSNQANQLTSAQSDYPHFAIGLSLYRGHWSDAATTQGEVVKQFEEVLKRHDGTWTEFKAGVAVANILCENRDPKTRAKGLAIYKQLIASGQHNRFAYIARINLANQLIRAKSIREGMTLLKEMPRSADSYYTIAQYELSEYVKKYGPLDRSTP